MKEIPFEEGTKCLQVGRKLKKFTQCSEVLKKIQFEQATTKQEMILKLHEIYLQLQVNATSDTLVNALAILANPEHRFEWPDASIKNSKKKRKNSRIHKSLLYQFGFIDYLSLVYSVKKSHTSLITNQISKKKKKKNSFLRNF